MTSQVLYYIILAIVVAGFLFGIVLDFLNSRTLNSRMPDAVKGIYDEEKYKKQQDYQRVNYRFELISGAFSFILILAMLCFKGFAVLDQFVRAISDSAIWQAILFFGILGLAADLLATPFDLYQTFGIEQKFGFNTTTAYTYVFDKIKGWLLAGILGGGILAMIVWLYNRTGDWFWVYVWGIITVFTVFINYFYTVLLLPLFNKLTPLEPGSLYSDIDQFAKKTGFSLKSIYTMDGSKRSTKGNAYFSGFGKQKKVVLFDTLVADHPNNELVAILAHEIGHYKKNHIFKGLALSFVQTGALLYILSLLVGSPVLSASLGSSFPGFHMGLLAFGILYSPVSEFLGIGMNAISRRHEYQADAFAAANHCGEDLQQALKKLSSKNLVNLLPHPFYVFVNYSHPPLLERLKALQKFKP